jgi:sortase A
MRRGWRSVIRRPTTSRRVLRAASTLLVVCGLLALVEAGLTLVWQEPISAVVATRAQDRLAGELRELERASPRASARAPMLRRSLARAVREAKKVEAGGPLGRLELPTLGRSFVVVQGADPASLRKGPGHYSDTKLPGQGGTVAVAGHRTTYLAPFRRLDRLRRGDTVVMDMPYGRFVYAVQGTRIVEPGAVWVKARAQYERLVLTACHPLYSAAKRIVVFARLAPARS